MGATGLEHPSNPAGKTRVSDSGGSKSGNKGSDSALPPPAKAPATPPTAADLALARVVAAWADLPPAVRAGILAMVDASRPGPADGAATSAGRP